jgi:hypothetical protein
VMLCRVSLGLCLAAIAMLPAGTAAAQDLIQRWFGYGRPAARPYAYPATPTYRSMYGSSGYGGYEPDWDREDVQPYAREATVRTLCVRLCDGFYFPISGATPRSELSRDADKCSAMCSAEAQLFYYPNAGGSVETMVDLTGMAYSALPNAFKYRKTLVKGCRCRPQPWSETELARHRGYAQGEARAVDVAVAPASESKPVVDMLPGPRDLERESEVSPVDRAAFERAELTGQAPRALSKRGVTVISDQSLQRPLPIERQVQAPPVPWRAGTSHRRDLSTYDWPVGTRRAP